jgi:DNA-binding CsgD family transcriptional regulator/tetratricopeptide (TPR) repeat protein
VLLEREIELDLLDSALARIGMTGGQVVLVRGEAGIGKSSLVNAFVEGRERNAHVYYGACDDLVIPRPLGPFWDIARDERSLVPLLEKGDRIAVMQAAIELLSASLRPSIMVIEDTQWSDEATLDAIKYLGRRIGRTNGLLVLTYRDGVVDFEHPLRGVIGDLPAGNVMRIQLAGLSGSAVRSITDGSGLDSDDVMAVTNGNPFFVTEMVAATGESVPSSVQDSVMSRVSRLSPQARDFLGAISVIPQALSSSDALRLTGSDGGVIDECVSRGFVERTDGSVSFRHELIRRAIESSLPEGERISANRRVLEELPGDNPAVLVHHAREAHDVDRILEFAPLAARGAASVGSHREAVSHFRQLSELTDQIGRSELSQILREWARAEFLVANFQKAIELNERALELHRHDADVIAESQTLTETALYHENAGHRDQAENLARLAVEVLGDDPAGSDLARALETEAYLQAMANRPRIAKELVDRTLEAGGEGIDELVLVRSLNHSGVVAAAEGYMKGQAALDAARTRAEAAGMWFEEARALVNFAWHATENRDLTRGSDYAQRTIASCIRHDIPTLESYGSAVYATVLDFTGDWEKAEDLARDQMDRMPLSRLVAHPLIGVLEARTGRPAAHHTLSEAHEAALGMRELQRRGPVVVAAAEHEWITNKAVLSRDEMKDVMSEWLRVGFKWSPGSIARWLWQLGELTEPPEGIAEPYRLLIEGEPQDAATLWRTIGIPYERALALMHGDLENRIEALEILETLGASAVAAKLRRTLRDDGVVVPRGKSRESRSHAAGLTARQAEILQLLDEGLTNIEIADRIFVSPRTVESHVSAVLAKLKCSTREGAVIQARAEGLLPVNDTSRRP